MGITLWQSLANQAKSMADNAFHGIEHLEDWKKARPERQKEFFECMGLHPLPERCAPKVTSYGQFSGEGYKATKIGFQISPDCWSSANIYYPDPAPTTKVPGILYVCGHGKIGSYHYQYHPIMWARRGYVCLIVDSIEQNDNTGEHHKSVRGQYDGCISMGYTSAGGEAWNAIRALDILEADPLVDADKLGITGVSGGGACSFHTAILDDRIKVVSTLCGISSPLDAIMNRGIYGHCDCMYPHNIHRRDISEYAALLAPKPALFCFAEHDILYRISENRSFVERTAKIYSLYEKEELCNLVTCPGKHGDHPEFDEATQIWFDKHLLREERPLLKRGERELESKTISVYNGETPQPDQMALLPELISKRGTVPLPRDKNEWPEIQDKALKTLPFKKFNGEATMSMTDDWQTSCLHKGTINGVDVWLETQVTPDSPRNVVLSIAVKGEAMLHAKCRLSLASTPALYAQAAFEPRITYGNVPVTPPVLSPAGSKPMSLEATFTRAMLLVGTTPVMMTIEDLDVAVDYLFSLEEMKGRNLYLYGYRESAVAAIYKALLDKRISGVVAEEVPSSHMESYPVLGVLKSFDLPQAVGLMAPRKIALVNPGHVNWNWPANVYERLECPDHFIQAGNTSHAFEQILS